MNKKKIALIVIGVLVLIAGIAVGVILVQQNQNIKEKAAPATNLSIIPSTQTKAGGDGVSFNVVMDTGENQITALDLVISFDPQVLQIISIAKGGALSDFSNELVNSIDNVGGNINYSNSTLDKSKAVNGSNLTVLTISGKVKGDAAAGGYQLAFLPQTTAAGLNEGVDVLVAKNPGTLVVSGPQATPTPTPTPTPAPTNQATPTPNPTGSSTPTPIATSTPGAAATPTTVATARPIPVTGISTPTIIFAGLGVFSIIVPLVLFIF